ncbi:hypothetical protein F8S13_11955 [Chloroflexia bacterium SDU3-3]|nr:hypothetical protein F8S13_11955 [Chloroflexia bacterium SDU3-3]
MSIIKTTPTTEAASGADLLQLDAALLETPAAKRALQVGLLQAKREALASAGVLARCGRPLLIAVIAVSFLHIWDTIALVKPTWVGELQLPAALYHATAGAFTLAIDAAAFYCVAASGTAALALGPQRRRWGVGFFMLLTFLLNAAYVVRYAPALDAAIRTGVLPLLDVLFAFLLPAFIPVAVVSVEGAAQRVELARLRLLVETTALEELIQSPVKLGGQKPQKASQSILGETARLSVGASVEALGEAVAGALSPGRPRYALADLVAHLPIGERRTRHELQQALGCGESTLDRLLAEAVTAGQVERAGRGMYQVKG